MNNDLYTINSYFNFIKLDAWIEQRPLSNGGYELIGMGRRTEYDYKTGAVISDVIEPTGLQGWSPENIQTYLAPSYGAKKKGR